MVGGYLDIELTGAGIVDTINKASQKGIVLQRISWRDPFCVSFLIGVSDYFAFIKLAAKHGDEIKISGRRGFYFWIRNAMIRPILIFGVLFLLVLSFWLPGHVLFVTVEGNESLSEYQILQKAEQCGVNFGAKRSVVRSERVKNQLLEMLPDLQWAGVNTIGCTAIISVREKTETKDQNDHSFFGSIVASRDGIILSSNVTSGYSACKVGDAVKEGDVLIFGRVDEDLLSKVSRPEGEIVAQTSRQCIAITPAQYDQNEEIIYRGKILSLIVGKKRINLSKDSGIYYTGCDKIYTEYWMLLPGGFRLPISFVIEEYVVSSTDKIDWGDAHDMLATSADNYILRQMISGTILSRESIVSAEDDIIILTADYLCSEMIGREHDEELDIIDGKNH